VRGGLELVVKVVHVVEPVGGMECRVLREGVTPAEEIAAGARVPDRPVAPSGAAAAATFAVGGAVAAASAAAVTTRWTAEARAP
jgi:hypothetical protein